MMDGRGDLALFTALVAAGTIGVHVGGPALGPTLGGALIMVVPGLAGIVAALVSRRSLRGFGWGLGRKRYLAVAYLLVVAFCSLPYLVALATGHGRITTEWWPRAAGNWGLPATPLAGLAMLATVNILFAMIPALGEEIGWRGYLVPRLARGGAGFRRVVAISYVLWLGFHLPGLLSGAYGNPAMPRFVAVAAFAAMLLPLSALMAWLRLRSGSLWPAVVAHGVHNSVLGELWASGVVGDAATPWLVGEFGLLTPIAATLVIGLVLRRRMPPPDMVA